MSMNEILTAAHVALVAYIIGAGFEVCFTYGRTSSGQYFCISLGAYITCPDSAQNLEGKFLRFVQTSQRGGLGLGFSQT